MTRIAELELRREAKVADLLGALADERFEASGVVALGEELYVIFDNTSQIGRFDAALDPAVARNELIAQSRARDTDYEDIAHDTTSGRFFILIEALPRGSQLLAKVREFDHGFDYVASAWLDFPLPGHNKGLEGLTCVRREDRLYLLGLCEGNRCERGADGRRPGGGRIQVFAEVDASHDWQHVDTIKLPQSLWFEDYASLAIRADRLCVVSQASSALWLGRLSPSAWAVQDDGVAFRFPTDAHGDAVYCNVEGVSWLSDDDVVVVSDKAKPGKHADRCRAKEQSVHVFAIPAGG